ncbi:MAG: glycosyltransferase family 4 protein [Paludibacteraceae bacterium]
MKILFVLHSGGANEGSGKAFLRFLPLLMERGVESLVILPTREGGLYDILSQSNISVLTTKYHYRFSVFPPSSTLRDRCLFFPRLCGRWMVNAYSLSQLLRIVKHFRPDLIHTNTSVCAIGYQVSRLLHIKHIWHIREYGALDFNYYYYPSRQWQLHRYRKNNSYTLCITKDIQRYNQLENDATSRVVYDGVLPRKAIIYKPQKQPYLLFVGYLSRGKGVLCLLEAYAIYRQRCLHPLPLWLAGKSSESCKERVDELVKEHDLSAHLSFLGLRQDVQQLYSEATALIVPSLSEGFGFITAEAMFYGCLVVGHDVAGTKEQFDNGVELTDEEIALRYTQQEQLVQHMLDITEAVEKGTFTEYYEPMILRAQKVVQQLYTSERNAEQIYQFYQDILVN